jgi:hypothetical protein
LLSEEEEETAAENRKNSCAPEARKLMRTEREGPDGDEFCLSEEEGEEERPKKR